MIKKLIISEKDNLYGFNDNERNVIPHKYLKAYDFHEGFAVVLQQTGKWNFIDTSGKIDTVREILDVSTHGVLIMRYILGKSWADYQKQIETYKKYIDDYGEPRNRRTITQEELIKEFKDKIEVLIDTAHNYYFAGIDGLPLKYTNNNNPITYSGAKRFIDGKSEVTQNLGTSTLYGIVDELGNEIVTPK